MQRKLSEQAYVITPARIGHSSTLHSVSVTGGFLGGVSFTARAFLRYNPMAQELLYSTREWRKLI